MSTNGKKLNIPIQINGGGDTPPTLLDRELYIDKKGCLHYGTNSGNKTLSVFGNDSSHIFIDNNAAPLTRFMRMRDIEFTATRAGVTIDGKLGSMDSTETYFFTNIISKFRLEKCDYYHGDNDNVKLTNSGIESDNIEVGALRGRRSYTYGTQLPDTPSNGQIFFLIK